MDSAQMGRTGPGDDAATLDQASTPSLTAEESLRLRADRITPSLRPLSYSLAEALALRTEWYAAGNWQQLAALDLGAQLAVQEMLAGLHRDVLALHDKFDVALDAAKSAPFIGAHVRKAMESKSDDR